MIQDFLQKAEEKIVNLSRKNVEKAYAFAKKEAKGVFRRNGEPYIRHTLALVDILLTLEIDEPTLLSALLFDSVLRNPENREKIEQEFGEEVAHLTSGIARLTEMQVHNTKEQSESLRDMFLSMAKDSRVALVRLADRLHNMQTLDVLPEEKQKKYAEETLVICAPIASRLGIFALKAPLEDLSFEYLFPEESARIQKQMHRHKKYRMHIIEHAQEKIETLLQQHTISGEVKGRVKHLYSIYKKLQKKGKDSIDDIYDIFAMRILVPNISDCYSMLGFIHEQYTPLQGRFKDYIAVPKPNGYRSLHTTVIGLSPFTDKIFPIEIQIRTHEMNREAEFGFAAHWSYKEKGSEKKAKKIPNPLSSLEEEVPQKIEEFFNRIYALTPRGDIKILPQGATPIDFAFSVHSDIGFHLKLAKANGKLVPLKYRIESGDVIEIVTSKDAKPSQNWVSICASSKTKQKIRAYFQKRNIINLIRSGKEMLNKYLRQMKCEELDQNLSVLKEYGGKRKNKREREELLLRIGNGSINASVVARNISVEQGKYTPSFASSSQKTTPEKEKLEDIGVIIGENKDIPVRTASCCKAKPGDKIVGFVTRGNHITIHKVTCRALKKLDERRLIEARYENESPGTYIEVRVTRNLDRTGFAHDILTLFREYNINLTKMMFSGKGPFPPVMIFGGEIQNPEHISLLSEKIKKVANVTQVKIEQKE